MVLSRCVAYGLGLSLWVVAVGANANNYTIDPAHTYPHFKINHLGFSTMQGRFNTTKGTLKMDIKKGVGEVDIVIDAASVDTGFQKRDEHLRSPDFLNVKEHPEIKFKSTKVTYKGDNAAMLEGNLTLMGISKPVSIQVDAIKCGMNPVSKKETCGFDGSTKIKRSDFGVKYGLPNVGDEMTISLEVEAIKN